MEKAIEEGAPQIHDRPNVQKFNEYTQGNIEKGLKEADFVLERTYKTAAEIHHPAETHGSRISVGEHCEVFTRQRKRISYVLFFLL